MEAGLEDYIASLQEIKKSEIGDMIDINISCPNAFGGEDFADPIWLKRLLTAIT
jgi:dihydroorotate dehydrogenase